MPQSCEPSCCTLRATTQSMWAPYRTVPMSHAADAMMPKVMEASCSVSMIPSASMKEDPKAEMDKITAE